MRPDNRLEPAPCRARVATDYAVDVALVTGMAVPPTRTQLGRDVGPLTTRGW
jgi:hypothetical protein